MIHRRTIRALTRDEQAAELAALQGLTQMQARRLLNARDILLARLRTSRTDIHD